MAAVSGAWQEVGAAVRERPSFGLYLAALAALPIGWLSPLSSLSERSGWTDVFIAAAVVVWAWERLKARDLAVPHALRGIYLALGLYLGLTALSAVFSDQPRQDVAVDVVLTGELIALAVLTADYATARRARDAIVWVIVLGALLTAALAALGLALFYLGVDTSLTGVYGEQFIASDTYARVKAGFSTPPLLASYCIFAAAVAAIDSDVPARLRRATELAMAVVVVLTLSRAILGFFAAMAIRAAGLRRTNAARVLAWGAAVAAIAVMAALTVGRLHLDPTRPSTISYTVPDPGNRREAFVTSLETLGDRPLLGEGPGALTGENRGLPFRAHFTPLNIAATVGLPALAAIATALLLLWRRRSRPTDIALWSGLAGLAIDGLGQDIDHFRHVWILIGLAAASVEGGRGAGPPDRS